MRTRGRGLSFDFAEDAYVSVRSERENALGIEVGNIQTTVMPPRTFEEGIAAGKQTICGARQISPVWSHLEVQVTAHNGVLSPLRSASANIEILWIHIPRIANISAPNIAVSSYYWIH